MTGAAHLRAQAEKCRALARRTTDGSVAANLLSLADEYDFEAARVETAPPPAASIPD